VAQQRKRLLLPAPTRLTGAGMVWIGSLVIILDWLMDFTTAELLPGGASVLYFLAALPVLLIGAVLTARDDR
jgi:hypothetical protein